MSTVWGHGEVFAAHRVVCENYGVALRAALFLNRHGDTNVAFMLDKKINLKRELAWFIPASSDEVGLALMPILILG